ncbi:unnamed protein product [Caenorhabditis bovis]|uniref:J domain-containing protein n=1 Tax=Caenorhabditis bovis TaxID=2654633 RepID=A0A8S1F804_9PELO|nr:unnamed protein product [Caenorhabditis bovis]
MIIRFLTFVVLTQVNYSWSSPEDVKNDISRAGELLSKGKYFDALSYYHKVIDMDPTNYQAIFRRATTYLAMGRAEKALADFNKVLELKSDFYGARNHKANILLKQGKLKEARLEYQKLPETKEVLAKISLLSELEEIRHTIKYAFEHENCDDVEESVGSLLEKIPWDPSLYQIRAVCRKIRKEFGKAIHDLKIASKLVSDSTTFMLEASKIQYQLGDFKDALNSLRECLRFDPDHEKCYSLYKKLKKFNKSLVSIEKVVAASEWLRCIQIAESLERKTDEEPILFNIRRFTCKCYRENGNLTSAIDSCTKALEKNSNDVELLLERADAYVVEENYDAAIADFKKVKSLDPENDKAHVGEKNAQRLKNNKGKRDYYKILGVKRNAAKREITKAYRKLAQKWHPDNFPNDIEKKKAEKKFIDIAAAKEILTNDEKRRLFDSGIDPLDSDAARENHNHGFNGFHGFNPFEGENGNFKFFYSNY